MTEQENTADELEDGFPPPDESAYIDHSGGTILPWGEPEYSNWWWELGNVSMRLQKGQVPNRFQRWMLTKFMGIKWEKIG